MDVLTKLVVAPTRKMDINKEFVEFVRTQIPTATPIKKDSAITVTLLGHNIYFRAVEVEPDIGVFQDETELEIVGEPLDPVASAVNLMTLMNTMVQKNELKKLTYPTEFIAKVIGEGRITIPEEYRELHSIQKGTILAVAFKVIKNV